MCGIAGLVDSESMNLAEATAVAEAMAESLRHRGPDDSGLSVDPTTRVALAQRRLAIIDLSPAGHQPMTTASGRWTIVCNGEIYNHRELRRDLEPTGVRFRGHSDTEALAEAIDRWGFDAALQRTNGMFAVAAWDAQRNRLFLARDRLGEKPLYWLQEGRRIAFASELRALRMLPGVTLQIDPAAMASLLHLSYIPSPRTAYVGVQQLRPGCLLDVDLTERTPTVTEATWWSLGDAIDNAIGERQPTTLDDAAAELEQLLADAVSLRLESDVPLGAFLSGGIDSSLIASFAQAATPAHDLRTFTVSMPDLGFDESAHAAAVAEHLGTRHETVDLSLSAALELIPRLSTIWDEPFADPSMLPTALLCSAAHDHLTVCLGGDGGDELFAGYNRHALGASLHRRVGRVPMLIRRAAASALLAPSPGTIDSIASRLSRVLPESRRVPNLGDKVQKAGALLRSDEASWELLAQIWPSEDLGVAPIHPCVPAISGELDEIERMMLVDTSSVLPDQMLVKVDRASMRAPIEVRVPFLDHRLLEWSWRQPMDVKTSGGVGKLVLRRLGERVLPPEIVQRPKMGFDPPLGGWFRHQLRPWAEDLFANPRSVSEGWLDRSSLQTVWAEHLSGKRNWDYRLWGVLMLESWLAEHHPV